MVISLPISYLNIMRVIIVSIGLFEYIILRITTKKTNYIKLKANTLIDIYF